MILVFDLDDTLYEEMAYVRSGFRAVAAYGEREFGLDATKSLENMLAHIAAHGRGKVFDNWLSTNGGFSRKRVSECMRIYRHHSPEIEMSSSTKSLLSTLRKNFHLYMVTDGHKVVQLKKVDALELKAVFKRIFFTHRFGLVNSKPSLHCFDIIRRVERVSWSDIVYVGDNPFKDFVNLNLIGAKTIRVRTGSYSKVVVSSVYDGALNIDTLDDLPTALLTVKPHVALNRTGQ